MIYVKLNDHNHVSGLPTGLFLVFLVKTLGIFMIALSEK